MESAVMRDSRIERCDLRFAMFVILLTLLTLLSRGTEARRHREDDSPDFQMRVKPEKTSVSSVPPWLASVESLESVKSVKSRLFTNRHRERFDHPILVLFRHLVIERQDD